MSASTDAAEINIGYLRRAEPKSTLSLIEVPAANDGVAGGLVAPPRHKNKGALPPLTFFVRTPSSRGGALAPACPRPATIARRRPAGGCARQGCRRRRRAQASVLQRRRDRRSTARGGLPRQRHSYRSNTIDARRCPGAVLGLEAVAQMAIGRRLPCRGQALRRC